MPSAILHCNYCGKKFRTVKEHILNSAGDFQCYNCQKQTYISFFDCCPVCHENVGFYDNGSLNYGATDFLSDFGSNVIKGLTSPIEAIKEGLNTMKSKNSNGAGICPNCKKRFMRCPSCSELTEIALSAKNTEIIPCSHCGQTLMPSGIKEEIGNKHSPAYYKH